MKEGGHVTVWAAFEGVAQGLATAEVGVGPLATAGVEPLTSPLRPFRTTGGAAGLAAATLAALQGLNAAGAEPLPADLVFVGAAGGAAEAEPLPAGLAVGGAAPAALAGLATGGAAPAVLAGTGAAVFAAAARIFACLT